MSATTNWKAAHDFTHTFDGVSQMCETCEVSETVGTFDTSNNLSGGFTEFGTDLETVAIRWTTVVDDDSPSLPPLGSLVTFSYVDGVETVSGRARITSRVRAGGAKGGYKFNLQATSTGAVTRT